MHGRRAPKIRHVGSFELTQRIACVGQTESAALSITHESKHCSKARETQRKARTVGRTKAAKPFAKPFRTLIGSCP
jgi:hypothetical protein